MALLAAGPGALFVFAAGTGQAAAGGGCREDAGVVVLEVILSHPQHGVVWNAVPIRSGLVHVGDPD